MLERLWDSLTGSGPLTRAMRGPDPEQFAEVFSRSTVAFLQLPRGCESGLDPNLSREELLAHLRADAKELSQAKEFTPFCRTRDGRKSLLLFTGKNFAKQFVHAYTIQVKRIMEFAVIGVHGRTALRLFDGADSVVFNPSTKHEYELPYEFFARLRMIPPAE
jgi:hypothetical protein